MLRRVGVSPFLPPLWQILAKNTGNDSVEGLADDDPGEDGHGLGRGSLTDLDGVIHC